MTQPTPTPVQSPEEQALLDSESLAYEMAAVRLVLALLVVSMAPVIALLAVLRSLISTARESDLTRTYPVVVGPEEITNLLNRVKPAMRPELEWQLQRGQVLGYSLAGGSKPEFPVEDAELLGLIENIDDQAAEQIKLVKRAVSVTSLETTEGVDLITALASKVVTDSTAAVRWAANRAVNLGTAEAAKEKQVGLVWVAERDACLHCLAYSGQIPDQTGRFPAALTFGSKPLKLSLRGYDVPPAHPNCRCRVWPYDGKGPVKLADMPNADVASALAREARRSVLRGWSDHASKTERLKAADRLLALGAALPKTVKRRAASNVDLGQFSQRHVPITTLKA